MNVFQEKIRDYRKKNGLSQEELAAALGISRAMISNWESGRSKPRPEMVEEISDKLKIQVNYSDLYNSSAGVNLKLEIKDILIDDKIDISDLEKIIRVLEDNDIILVYKGKEITNEDKIAMSTMIRMYLEVKRWL